MLKATCELAKNYKLPEKEKKLNIFIDRLKRGKTVVVVCGEFKRGKSSFINALVEEPDLCPVDIDITTNMATQIQYSENEYARVFFDNESGKKPIQIPRSDIPNYVTESGNKENNQMVKMVDIGIPKEKLNKGLMMIVDTPGVGSLNVKHSEVTALYLNYADVVLFVSDTNAPLTIPEIDFVKRANKYCPNIYFILTKIDKVRDWKLIEEENRKKLAEALSKPAESIKIFPVSSLNKLDFIKTSDEESLEDSKFEQMEEVLIKELSSSVAKNILLLPLFTAKNDTYNIRKSLSLQHQAFQQESIEKKKEIEEKLGEINEKYKAIQKSNSRWQMILSDNTVEIKSKMRRITNRGFSNLEENIKVKVTDNSFRESPDNINALIKNSVIDIIKDVDDLISNEVSEMQEKIYDIIGQEVKFDMDDLNLVDIVEVNPNKVLDSRNNVERMGDWGRTVSIKTGSFAAGGAFIGGIVGGAAGFFGGAGIAAIPAAQAGAAWGGFIGATIGSVFGATGHKKEIEKRLQADTIRTCMEIIRENKVNCFDIIDSQFNKIISEIRNSIVFSIQESMETIEKTRNEINKNLSLNATEVNQKSIKIQEYIKQVTSLENQINNTITEVQKI